MRRSGIIDCVGRDKESVALSFLRTAWTGTNPLPWGEISLNKLRIEPLNLN